MAIKFFCDRCSREVERHNIYQIGITKSERPVLGLPASHLCKGCAEDLGDFLNKETQGEEDLPLKGMMI